MNSVEYWSYYKDQVSNTLVNAGSNTPVILTFGLASEISEVFEVTQKEIIHGKKLTKERISELGDVLWYIAAIESFYELPHPRYANYLGIPFELNSTHGINLLETQSEALAFASEISLAMANGEVDEVQYNLNKILAIVFDVCMVYGLNIIDCFESNIEKMNLRHPNGYDKNASKEYRKEFKATQKRIKERGAAEILVDLKLDNRNNDPYKHITVTAKGETFTFNAGDIIVDFFEASNFIANEFQDIEYLINYSPKFRQLLDETVEDLFMGFMYHGELVSALEMRQRMQSKTEGNMVRLGKEGRPVLMTPKMEKLNDLLDYINDNKTIDKCTK